MRMSVAKSELTFSTPTLAKIAVSAAKAADASAQNCHEPVTFISGTFLGRTGRIMREIVRLR